VLDALRAYSTTADAHQRASRGRQIREADEAIERASADLDDTIRQLGELGLLSRPASQETLEKLAKTLDDAHAARARLGDGGQSNIIGPDEIDKLREPVKRLAASDMPIHGRWVPFSVMRGLINPVFDRALEHDPKLRRLILKLEQQACQARDQTFDDTVSSENGTAIPSSASGPSSSSASYLRGNGCRC